MKGPGKSLMIQIRMEQPVKTVCKFCFEINRTDHNIRKVFMFDRNYAVLVIHTILCGRKLLGVGDIHKFLGEVGNLWKRLMKMTTNGWRIFALFSFLPLKNIIFLALIP